MPEFAANLSMMFPELPFLDRFAAAADAGMELAAIAGVRGYWHSIPSVYPRNSRCPLPSLLKSPMAKSGETPNCRIKVENPAPPDRSARLPGSPR